MLPSDNSSHETEPDLLTKIFGKEGEVGLQREIAYSELVVVPEDAIVVETEPTEDN